MTLQDLLDKQEITELIHGYAHAMDRQDAAWAGRLFTADAQLRLGVFEGPAATVIAGMKQGAPTGYAVMHHTLTNILIRLDGDHARAVSYLHVVHRREVDGGSKDETLRGRYLDSFTRTDTGWRFAERVLVFDWSRVEPSTPDDFWDRAASPLVGSVGPSDPGWGFLEGAPHGA